MYKFLQEPDAFKDQGTQTKFVSNRTLCRGWHSPTTTCPSQVDFPYGYSLRLLLLIYVDRFPKCIPKGTTVRVSCCRHCLWYQS